MFNYVIVHPIHHNGLDLCGLFTEKLKKENNLKYFQFLGINIIAQNITL